MNVDERTLRRILREEIGTELDLRLEAFELRLAEFFGKTQRHLSRQFKRFEAKYDQKFGSLQATVDGIVKRMDDDDIENVAMRAHLQRHDTWINELTTNTGTKLPPP